MTLKIDPAGIAVAAYDADMLRRSTRALTALAIVTTIGSLGCGRKLLPDSALTMPRPPADGRQANAAPPPPPAEAPKDLGTKTRAARTTHAPLFASPTPEPQPPIADSSAGAKGTSGSVSIVSVKPDVSPAGAAGTLTVQTRTRSTRKPILAGAGVLAALVAAAFRLVPRRYPA